MGKVLLDLEPTVGDLRRAYIYNYNLGNFYEAYHYVCAMNASLPNGAMVDDLPDLVMESNSPRAADDWAGHCQDMCNRYFVLVLKAQAVYREEMIEELNR